MAFQVIFVSLLTALMIFSSEWRLVVGSNTQKSQPTKHGEVYRAKSQIDSLIYKLTLDLDTFNEKKTLAGIMQKDAEKLARIVDEEIRLLKPVQHLLDQLAKGNASNGYQRCLGGIGGKIPIRIEMKSSSLPVHYTISVAGMSVLHASLLSVLFLYPQSPPTLINTVTCTWLRSGEI